MSVESGARGAQVFLQNLKPTNFTGFVYSPLWHNSHLSFQYRQDWTNKGYRLMKDILNTQGDLISLGCEKDVQTPINVFSLRTTSLFLKFNLNGQTI